MLLLRANTLALGHSGCRPVLVDRLLAFLDAGIHPDRAGPGLRRRVRRPRAARPSRPAADRPRPGGARRPAHVPALVALREVGLEPLVLEAKEGLALLNGTQLMTRDRGAAAGRRRSARPDGERRRGDQRRGAARHGRRVRGRLPARATASRPDRGRRRAPPSAPRLVAPGRPHTATPTRSRTRTRSAACRRSTARSATRSTTCAASSTSR